MESGQAIDLRVSYVRNASGVIQQQIVKSNDLITLGVDSIITVVNYDAANSRYKSGVSVFSIFGLGIRDSIVF